MSASLQSTRDEPQHQSSREMAHDTHPNIDSEQNHQQFERNFQNPLCPDETNIPRRVRLLPTSKESVARRLQRIDILLNLVYSRVANDRSLKELLPYIPEHEARNLVSNFAYVRHQQDTQELKSEMTDRQTYRIFRHHYRAEQRLADTLRKLRHSSAETGSPELSEASPDGKSMEHTSPLSQPVVDLENDTAQMRMHHLQQVQSELNQMSDMYESDNDLLYIQEFSQAQQVNTMQARCVAMKDEYEADDIRRCRSSSEQVSKIRKPANNISGPENWEEGPPQSEAVAPTFPALGLRNGEWTPPDPPRSPCLNVRQRRSRQQPDNDLPQNGFQGRGRNTYRNENHERTAQFHGRSERRDRRGSSSRKPFTVTTPKRRNSPYLEDYGSRQQRYSRFRPPLPDRHQDERHRLDPHTTQVTSKRRGRSQRTSRAQAIPKNSIATANQVGMGNGRYYDTNAEFATMPNLRRTSHGYHRETSYDDSYMPLQGGSGQNQYVGDHSSGPFRKTFPHESADAFGWKPPAGSIGTYYDSGAQEQPPPYPQPDNPQFPHNLSAPSLPQGGLRSQAVGEHMPAATKTRNRDEWRYNHGLASGRVDIKDGVGVFYNIAKKVKGRKEKPRVPQNPIAAVQMARKDPVKFMTTMVAGEIMPHAKRKAHKFESMLGHESHADGAKGQVGKVLTKVAKESMTHGSSSKRVQGQVGHALAKMALDSAMGVGSSKAKVTSQSKTDGVTGQVGKMLTKVAKDSMIHGSSSKKGVQGQVGGMLAKMALDSATGGGSSKAKVASKSKTDGVTEEVGKMLTKVAKESMTHGSSSKRVQGQVGQMLAKMTQDSATGGGSSKANVTSQVENVLTKVAKESVQQAGASTSGTKVFKQIMNSVANA